MFDEHPIEINDVSPTSLNHLIGQKGVVDQVTVAIDAAFADNKRMDHCLLVGPPGVGKTAVANVIACEMAGQLHELLGQSIKTPADLNAVLLTAQDGDVVHIDEAHELKKEYQTALYLAVDQQRIFLQPGKPGRTPQSFPVEKFTLLVSTTDEYSLLQPLRDRMRLVLRFDFYAPEDLTTVLVLRSRALSWDVEEQLFPEIATRSRGTPRLALRLLQSCRRVCRAVGESTITLQHLHRACRLEQIDDLGLGPTEQKYLRHMADGASRLNVIASLLGLPARTVSQVTEPFLMRAGLIVKDDQGRRELTPFGREHLSNLRKQSI